MVPQATETWFVYELIVVACLLAQPAKCEEFPLPFQQPMGMTECMREGQLYLAEWLAGHSDWVIRRWSCAMPRA
jgi:hypothetical protein